MKNTNVCPKCNSTDIIRVEGAVGAYGAGNNISIGLTTLSSVKVHRYMCCNCGFTEEWIDKEDIAKVKKRYK